MDLRKFKVQFRIHTSVFPDCAPHANSGESSKTLLQSLSPFATDYNVMIMLLEMVDIKRLMLMLTIMTTIKYVSWNGVTYIYIVHVELQMMRL